MVSAVLDLVSAPGVLYAAVLVLLTVDAFVPVVPAQALMIGGGILSASGHVQLALLVLAGTAGVFAGDFLAFLVGRRLARRGRRPARPLPRRAQAIADRLDDIMRRHVFLAVLFCRFVPAGRMVTAVYAGRNGMSRRRFAGYDVVAAGLWASYGALLGHFGGEAIEDSSWLPLLLIAAAALAFVAGAPLVGFVNKLRRRRVPARACRRTAMETLAAAEPMAAIEVLVAAEAVAAAESVVVQVSGLESATP
ncbi:DedA family protein [Dactylosporangium sp. CA-092794]|uniref:DedA family protein n=1 Tax=Dactylosporangium sp. CA-092794 TaxID=3239929 RepID=UPI003D8FFADD